MELNKSEEINRNCEVIIKEELEQKQYSKDNSEKSDVLCATNTSDEDSSQNIIIDSEENAADLSCKNSNKFPIDENNISLNESILKQILTHRDPEKCSEIQSDIISIEEHKITLDGSKENIKSDHEEHEEEGMDKCTSSTCSPKQEYNTIDGCEEPIVGLTVEYSDASDDGLLLNISSESETSPTKKRKRRKVNRDGWKQNVRKKRRSLGLSYLSSTNKNKPGRYLKEGCGANCRMRCQEKINLETRNALFDEFWNLGAIEKQRDFVVNLVKQMEKKTEKTNVIDIQRNRRYTLNYNLMQDNDLIKVCKKMFLDTFCISGQFIVTSLDKSDSPLISKFKDQRVKNNHRRPIKELPKESEDLLQSLTNTPLHYGIKNLPNSFIPGRMNLTKIYDEYVKMCVEQQIPVQCIQNNLLSTITGENDFVTLDGCHKKGNEKNKKKNKKSGISNPIPSTSSAKQNRLVLEECLTKNLGHFDEKDINVDSDTEKLLHLTKIYQNFLRLYMEKHSSVPSAVIDSGPFSEIRKEKESGTLDGCQIKGKENITSNHGKIISDNSVPSTSSSKQDCNTKNRVQFAEREVHSDKVNVTCVGHTDRTIENQDYLPLEYNTQNHEQFEEREFLANKVAKTFVGLADNENKTFVGLANRETENLIGLADKHTETFEGLTDKENETFVGHPDMQNKTLTNPTDTFIGLAAKVTENFLGLAANETEAFLGHGVDDNNSAFDQDLDANINSDMESSSKKKKRTINSESWKQNLRKKRRNLGLSYRTTSNKEHPGRYVKEGCNTNCRMHCQDKIKFETRKTLFDIFWNSGNVEKQRNVIVNLVKQKEKKTTKIKRRNNDTTEEASIHKNRNYTLVYNLVQENSLIQVCKKMFLDTLCISSQFVVTTIKKLKSTGIQEQRGKHVSRCISQELQKGITNHIDSLIVIPMHFCTNGNTSKSYIPGGKNLTVIYEEYVRMCNEKNIPVAKKSTYGYIFKKDYKLEFSVPKKNQCDYCYTFEKRNCNENFNIWKNNI